jgi:NTP pyrophosphatase (non-canonical NTP hydrolase)
MDIDKLEITQVDPEMGLNEYQQLALRTEKPLEGLDRLVHAALGAVSDSGELATAVKAAWVYGKNLDGENVREEIGDILWYLAIAADAIETSLSECARCNIEKLKKRYPEKYTDQDAIKRADKQ